MYLNIIKAVYDKTQASHVALVITNSPSNDIRET